MIQNINQTKIGQAQLRDGRRGDGDRPPEECLPVYDVVCIVPVGQLFAKINALVQTVTLHLKLIKEIQKVSGHEVDASERNGNHVQQMAGG